MDKSFYSYKVEDKSYTSFVKREIHNLITTNGYKPHKVGEIDIVVSELLTNLTKFVGEGEFLYRLGTDNKGDFFEMYCLDKGAGIKNINQMMKDGISTVNTLGQGLGAVERLSSESAFFTARNWGTVAYSKIYKEPTETTFEKPVIDFGAIQVPIAGELVCGDGYHIKHTDKGIYFFLGDGLGHGEHAHEAVSEAIKAFRICREKSPVEMLQFIHREVKKTRGLVATIVFLNLTTRKWHICGVGNISTSIFTGLECKNYTPYNGIVGLNIPRTLTESTYDVQKYQTLFMHSDGLQTRWNLLNMPGLLKHSPNVIAGALYNEYARKTDDMSVLAAKINS